MQAGERVIGQEQAAYHEKRLLGTRPISGRLYVTDKRVAFVVGIAHSLENAINSRGCSIKSWPAIFARLEFRRTAETLAAAKTALQRPQRRPGQPA